LSDTDRTFVQKAIDGGAKEVQVSEVAAQRAQSKAVQEFAAMVVRDHEKANRQLMELHRKLLASGGPTQKKTDRDVKREVEALNAAEGAELDRQYMEMMVQDHQESVELFERQAQKGKDPQLRSTAQEILPTLERHLAMARKVVAELQK
jgi:putative membrane protein